MQECSLISYESDVDGSGDMGVLLLTTFLFLLQKIDTILKSVHWLLAVIYNHTKYENVHLQMTTDSTLFGHSSGGHCVFLQWNPLFLNPLREEIIARTIKEMTLMNINVYQTPLNKSTDQTIKLRLPSYLVIITGFSLLQYKKGECYTHVHPYIVHMKFQNSHK